MVCRQREPLCGAKTDLFNPQLADAIDSRLHGKRANGNGKALHFMGVNEHSDTMAWAWVESAAEITNRAVEPGSIAQGPASPLNVPSGRNTSPRHQAQWQNAMQAPAWTLPTRGTPVARAWWYASSSRLVLRTFPQEQSLFESSDRLEGGSDDCREALLPGAAGFFPWNCEHPNCHHRVCKQKREC